MLFLSTVAASEHLTGPSYVVPARPLSASSPSVCRSCGQPLREVFADLGVSPLSNSFLKREQLRAMEAFYPLCAFVCNTCWLVQLEQYESPDRIFSSEYAYFSSYSDTWLEHARQYADRAIAQFHLGPTSQVVEIASNDGYLLQFFRKKGIPVLGIEPAGNVAEAAIAKGIPTKVSFFGADTAVDLVRAGFAADLLIGNNVYAHVPDLHSFTDGMKSILKPYGVITLEFPHLLQLIRNRQFDTIYHEHFSYFSLLSVERIFADRGLAVFDVEELPTHGGSLRIYGKHQEDHTKPVHERVGGLRHCEIAAGLDDLNAYRSFSAAVVDIKCSILDFLLRARVAGKKVAGYGAPAKANTLLNYCGIGPELLQCTVDRSPHKQGLYLPGSRIPVLSPEVIREIQPDYLVILPWNLREEIALQMEHIRGWGGRFVVFIPTTEVF